MTFKGYYNSLDDDAKIVLRNRIIEVTGIGYSTFYNWLNGSTKNINKLHRAAIADITGLNVESLFETEAV